MAQKNLEESKSEALKAIEVANTRKECEQQAAEKARQARAARDKFMQGERHTHSYARVESSRAYLTSLHEACLRV